MGEENLGNSFIYRRLYNHQEPNLQSVRQSLLQGTTKWRSKGMISCTGQLMECYKTKSKIKRVKKVVFGNVWASWPCRINHHRGIFSSAVQNVFTAAILVEQNNSKNDFPLGNKGYFYANIFDICSSNITNNLLFQHDRHEHTRPIACPVCFGKLGPNPRDSQPRLNYLKWPPLVEEICE